MLPKNSKITAGKTWPRSAGARNPREFRVYRWNPDDASNPRMDTYFVDLDDCAACRANPRVSHDAARPHQPGEDEQDGDRLWLCDRRVHRHDRHYQRHCDNADA